MRMLKEGRAYMLSSLYYKHFAYVIDFNTRT